MDIQLHTQYDAQPTRVAAVLASRDLAEKRASALGLHDYSWNITHPHEDTTCTTTRLVLPTEVLPSQVQKFMSAGLTVTVTSTIGTPNTHGSIIVTHTVNVEGAPVTAKATITLTNATHAATANAHNSENASSTTRAEVSAQFSVSIPFIGQRIEREAVTYIEQALREDTCLVNALLKREQ